MRLLQGSQWANPVLAHCTGGGVDILGPFSTNGQENSHILVAMNYFSKWPNAYVVPDQSASTTAECLVP